MTRLLFIGIAGHAMRGLALAARDRGFEVRGLDATAVPPGSDWLDEHGLDWTTHATPELLDGVDTVVISGGTTVDDPTTVEAIRRGIRVISFAEFLGEISAGKHVISVAGTHGKTTTSSLITWLLESAGRKPDFLIGIQPFNFDSSARLDGAHVVVIEGDEYKASSLDTRSKIDFYHPDVLVVTSLEMDHPDIFRDFAEIEGRFEAIVHRLPRNGRFVAWSDDPVVSRLAAKTKARTVLYGLESGSVLARNISYQPGGIEYDLEVEGKIHGRLAVPLYGRHNVLNSLAACAVAIGEGLTFDQILTGAASFKGAYRRFNILTPAGSKVVVIDDYAHHPTEVAATIEAARLHYPHHRLTAVFRPHTYSRTKTLLPEFQAAFAGADRAFITEVESAREAANEATVSGADIVRGIHGDATFAPDRQQLAEQLVRDAQAGDVILCMSVSGYDKLAEELASRLAK